MEDEDNIAPITPRPALSRETCLRIIEEGQRAHDALSPIGEAGETRDSIESLSDSFSILDELVVANGDPDHVIEHARKARSNCARSIALCVRGAIEWGDLPPGSLVALQLFACAAPDAWTPAGAAARAA